MKFDPILPQSRIDAAQAEGVWPNKMFTEYLDANVATHADHAAVIDFNSMTGRGTTLSFRQLQRISTRMALAMTALGVEAGDVVSCQLPNWWQFTALYLACVRIGAAFNPLMPIFRHRELSFMLEFCEAKLMVIPRQFRGFDYPAMMAEIRGDLPKLEQLLVIGGEGDDSFEQVMVERRWEDELDGPAVFDARPSDPNAVTLLLYTSGTTGQPKGVMHTSNTLMHGAENLNKLLGMDRDAPMLMPSPLAHITGFLCGMVQPLLAGTKSVLQDIWDPVVAAQLIQDEGVVLMLAATPFLADLTHNPGVANYDISSLRNFHTGGAPIPRVLVQAATEKLDATVTTAWGMSETALVTTTTPTDPQEKLFETDGKAVFGMKVRILDAEGNPLPTGAEGRLQCQCQSLFVGYLKRPDEYGVDAEGWFETGDLARMDEEGYIRITGRSKDIIIRGGENIPIVEVEQLLYRHPDIEDAAIVAMPDERLGERGCAFVTLRSGSTMTFADMNMYLSENNLARNYFPERLEQIAEMPRTPSGKIQKFKLRELAQNLSPE